MRASSKLVWVSFFVLCEITVVWSFAQGAAGVSSAPRQARRDVPGVENWPSFLDSPTADARQHLEATVPVTGPDAAALRATGMEPFELAKTVAQVGDQCILKGELIADANLMLMKEFAAIEKLPEDQREQARSTLLANRDALVEQLLPLAIDRKLLYLEFLRDMPPQDQKKLDEVWKKIRKQIGETFNTQLSEMAAKVRTSGPEKYPSFVRQDYQLFRISIAMKDNNIESPEDPRLERVLRDNGTSLYSQQQAFMERALGRTMVPKKVNFHPEITHDQMLNYYREHIAESQVETRARWEQLTVLFSRCKDKYEAGDLIASMGNKVRFGGAEFWAVAQKLSHEKNAENGGYHDWTTLGDLRISKELSDAVFTLPLNELSGIIIDDEGLHIIRVLEREQAHLIPFTEAQVDIKKSLHNEALNKEYSEYVAKLREKTPIWTADKGFLPRDERTRRN